MLIQSRNPIETVQEMSAISENVAAGASQFKVLNTEGFSAGQFIVIKKIGDEQAELRRVSQITGGNTVSLNSALSFSHDPGTVVSVISYDQVEVSRKTTASGSFTVLSTFSLDVDEELTSYNDTNGQTTYFYRTRFYNSYTGQYSDYSAIRKGTGPSTKEVSKMIDMVLRRTEDPKGEYTTRPQVLDDLNSAYQEIINSVNQSSSGYYRSVVEIPMESYKYEYTLPDDFREIQEVRDADGNLVPPSPRNTIFDSEPGYELTGLNTVRFNDVPTPATDETVPMTVSANNAYSDDGTWAASSDASNVTTDLDVFITGNGSINFDITNSAHVAVLTNSTLTSQDLSDYDDGGKWRLWFYIPDITYISSFDFRWGSSSANYWSLNTTTDYKNQAFHDGWNLLEFIWGSTNTTETGTPDSSAITYLQLRLNYSARQPTTTDFRLDAIFLATSYPVNWLYEVTYLYQPAQLTNEMDELQIPPGNQYLIVDYAVAQVLMRKGERDALAQKLLDNFNEKIGRFIAQSSKRTRRPIGMRPYGRKRHYFTRSGAPLVSKNVDMIVRKI